MNGAYWRTSKLRVAPAAKRKAPQPPAPPPTKKKKVQKPPQQERRTQTKRERFLELSGVKAPAPAAVAEAEATEKCEEAYDDSLDDLAYLRSKRDGVRGGVLVRAPRRVGGSAESAPTTASGLTVSPRRPTTTRRSKKTRTATTTAMRACFCRISRTVLRRRR